jgi:hypothetical protein
MKIDMPWLLREKRRIDRTLWTLPFGPWRGVPLDDVPPRVLQHALNHMDLRDGLRRRIRGILDERRRILTAWLKRMAKGRFILVCGRGGGRCDLGQGGAA